MIKRIFLIVMDSVGMGAAPDAAQFGDGDVNTLKSVFADRSLSVPTLTSLGLCNIEGATFGQPVPSPRGAFARMRERAAGKDTTTGHWEIAGLTQEKPFPTYPGGFPEELIREYSRLTGHEILCNAPYSGTQVIHDYGREQIAKNALIVYTSADSVFQVAAHEKYIGLAELYRCCGIARELLRGEHAVARVIARPYVGEWQKFVRTDNRRDYSLTPPKPTLLDAVSGAGYECIGVGKISDIFAGRGLTSSHHISGNTEGMEITKRLACEGFNAGLCFVNLVDFDMLYGHRRDVPGYAAALTRFDGELAGLISCLGSEDMLILTADHGCDPAAPGTDHTREYVPMIAFGAGIRAGVDLGTRGSFADIAASAAAALRLSCELDGESFFADIKA